ncbi:NfeD-like family protein 1 [Bordetella genomosp. 10]|uniref:NfeD-like family protein 1 n=1 Tax=Bordetella genomosp. 10 TaxID=1416804 RepID=A0A261SDU2_9BORD|nr:NfeD family protein [Bordetella genomosp. 10]OZI34970.1 NfeD-like family protein 1 [Bordetella genomosp. 10]
MWIWFGLAVLALIGEIASGTFYLLLVAVGLAAGGLAAAGGVSLEAQLLACSIVALAGLFLLRRTGVLKKREVDAARNADVNLDIGQVVRVDAWDADGMARVQYRGASWQVELAPGNTPQGGEFVITAVRGSSLIVAPRATPARS